MDFNYEVSRFLQGDSAQAYCVFGAHPDHQYDQNGVTFAVFAPYAAKMELIGEFSDWNPWPMHRREDGVWTIFCRDVFPGQMYKYRVTAQDGSVFDKADPFAFYSELRPGTASIVWDIDQYIWHDEEWMRARAHCGKNYNKPMNVYEVHPGSWQRVHSAEDPGDNPDDAGLRQQRAEAAAGKTHKPVEAHIPNPPSDYHGKHKKLVPEELEFGRQLTYWELADRLIPYVQEHHYTHIELMPLTEHPFDGSWGYQATGYFSATSRYGDPSGLMEFVDRCHQAGIGVILDVVPLHYVTDSFGLSQFDGGYVYENGNPNLRYTQWGTILFDYTKPHTMSFMKSSLDFWINYYHVDGLRYDAVSQLIYNYGNPEQGLNETGLFFLHTVNYYLRNKYPGIMLMAEDSSNYGRVTAPPEYGGVGFDYKWDLGWMNDTLKYFGFHPNQRKDPNIRNTLTFSMSYFYSDLFILPLSHDEVVHGKHTIIDKMWGNYTEKFSQVRLLNIYMAAHPGKTLNFMGNELAEFREWDEKKELGWNLRTFPVHDSFGRLIQTLNEISATEPALYENDYDSRYFRWVDIPSNDNTLFAFKRWSRSGEEIMCIMNCGLYPMDYRYIPELDGEWTELINSDSTLYSGSGVVNLGHISQYVSLAPLSACLMKRVTDKEQYERRRAEQQRAFAEEQRKRAEAEKKTRRARRKKTT